MEIVIARERYKRALMRASAQELSGAISSSA